MESERMCFTVRKISRRAVLLLGGALTLTALTGCWPNDGSSSSEQAKNAVKTALKEAVERSECSYNLVEDKTLSEKARAILEGYLKDKSAEVYNPLDVTDVYPTDVNVGCDDFGTLVFFMPENAVESQAWKRAADAVVEGFLWHYNYNDNVKFCVEIVKQEAADGQGKATDYMVIFAKICYGQEGGGIDTPPKL